MSRSNASESKNFDERLVALEELLAHLQHTLDQLNAEVTQQGRQIDATRGEVAGLADRLRLMQESPEEQRDPLDEKPPHY